MHNYTQICEKFFAPLYELIICKPCPRLSDKAIEVLQDIGDWYIDERSTYINIYGETKAPHTLPVHVPNRLVIREVAYKTAIHGFNAYLARHQKKLCPPYPISIDLYGLTYSAWARMEGEKMEGYHIHEERYKNVWSKGNCRKALGISKNSFSLHSWVEWFRRSKEACPNLWCYASRQAITEEQ